MILKHYPTSIRNQRNQVLFGGSWGAFAPHPLALPLLLGHVNGNYIYNMIRSKSINLTCLVRAIKNFVEIPLTTKFSYDCPSHLPPWTQGSTYLFSLSSRMWMRNMASLQYSRYSSSSSFCMLIWFCWYHCCFFCSSTVSWRLGERSQEYMVYHN